MLGHNLFSRVVFFVILHIIFNTVLEIKLQNSSVLTRWRILIDMFHQQYLFEGQQP